MSIPTESRQAFPSRNALRSKARGSIAILREVQQVAHAHIDPRIAHSRARLLEAATTLLRSGGPSAVTVDAVTRASHVARATLYRHFASGNDLVAAAFHALIPPAPIAPPDGSVRDRLLAAVSAQAELIAEVPVGLVAMSWLALGGDLEHLPWGRGKDSSASAEIQTLRERVAEQYAAPFDAIFDSEDAIAEFGEIDRTRAAALLLGPIVLGKFSMVANFDYRAVVPAAVDGFLATHCRRLQPSSS